MYWGKQDVSVFFCEDKYSHSNYIAEYYNTITAIPYIIVGIFYYRTKLKNIGISIIFLGIGTGVLHCTLRYYGQMLDEISMLVLSFNIINKIRYRQFLKELSNKYLPFLILIYLYFYNNFLVFFTIFTSMQIYTYYLVSNRKNKEISKSNRYVSLYINIFVFSTFCWILDQVFCEYVKFLYLHAVWHIGTSLSLFIGLIPFLYN